MLVPHGIFRKPLLEKLEDPLECGLKVSLALAGSLGGMVIWRAQLPVTCGCLDFLTE